MSDQQRLTDGNEDGREVADIQGSVAELMDPELKEKYEKLFRIADKSPIVNAGDEMKKWDANQDFIVFKDKSGNGHFDIQRGFALKAMKVFKYGKRNLVLQTTETNNGNLVFTLTGEVFDIEHPEDFTTCVGGCSTREIASKGSGGRLEHDAAAIAETRMLKRGVEEKVGAPIINAMIREIFGGFEIKARELRDVTPGQPGNRGDKKKGDPTVDGKPVHYPPETKALMKSFAQRVAGARNSGVFTADEFEHWKQRALGVVETYGVLKNISDEMDRTIATRLQESENV